MSNDAHFTILTHILSDCLPELLDQFIAIIVESYLKAISLTQVNTGYSYSFKYFSIEEGKIISYCLI